MMSLTTSIPTYGLLFPQRLPRESPTRRLLARGGFCATKVTSIAQMSGPVWLPRRWGMVRMLRSMQPPPLEAKRMLSSQWATERNRNGHNLKLSFIDVRKAYFHGTPTRQLFDKFPKEMGMGTGYVARLDKCVYGTRDAGMLWEMVYTEALKSAGFIQGVASPCCFFHPAWGGERSRPRGRFYSPGSFPGLGHI